MVTCSSRTGWLRAGVFLFVAAASHDTMDGWLCCTCVHVRVWCGVWPDSYIYPFGTLNRLDCIAYTHTTYTGRLVCSSSIHPSVSFIHLIATFHYSIASRTAQHPLKHTHTNHRTRCGATNAISSSCLSVWLDELESSRDELRIHPYLSARYINPMQRTLSVIGPYSPHVTSTHVHGTHKFLSSSSNEWHMAIRAVISTAASKANTASKTGRQRAGQLSPSQQTDRSVATPLTLHAHHHHPTHACEEVQR
mmetsp:Transcript_44473/g.125799  ORF Transcript_44473/g.125799 Transcript_44473/m.125799 type:complete len:250 (-) Transcript_44473:749-1498(-)